MPGFGGGRMPGMPGGLGQLGPMLAPLLKALEAKLAQFGLEAEPKEVVGLCVALVVAWRYLALWVAGVVGLIAAWSRTARGRDMVENAAAKASSLAGRPVPPGALVAVVCALVAAYAWSSTDSPLVPPGNPDSGVEMSIREAYNDGYRDGVDGKDPRPPRYFASQSSGGSSSSGFGIGSLFRYFMVANYLYRSGMAPGGWSFQAALANVQANPLQAVIMLSMLSGGMGLF